MKKATIHEIAKALGLDSSTVSRALNDSDRVKQKTKERVLKKAKEMGYTRNILASNLRRNRSNTIGVIIPRMSRHFFSTVMAGIEEAAYKLGYNIITSQSLEHLDREQKIVENMILNRVDGVLISVSMETTKAQHLEALVDAGIPLVFFDRHLPHFRNYGKVIIDDYQGAYLATTHLIEQGHRSIAHFSGPLNLSIYQSRLEGYKKGLEKHGIPFKKDLVYTSRLMEEDGAVMAERLLKSHPNVDALFSANDIAALGAMKYVKKIGLRIPQDLAIAGFSNEPISEAIEPSLTTVDQAGETIGRLACELLIKRINNTDPDIQDETQKISPTLIIRESSGKRGH